jgi:hypothetical protein
MPPFTLYLYDKCFQTQCLKKRTLNSLNILTKIDFLFILPYTVNIYQQIRGKPCFLPILL